MEEKTHQLPIWLFIGGLLAFYGALITGHGVYRLFRPAPSRVALSELHADVWWGALLLVIGVVYCVKYWPSRGKRD